MSLSKQLLLLISVLFALIFVGNFAVSLDRMRDYLQVEARVHAQDTATSLGLSLSPHIADPHDPILETMIRAIYDMGYYREIRLTDVEGRVLALAGDGRVFEQVPAWFVRWLPMEAATASTEISSGWNLAARLEVSINPGYAYLELYGQMRAAFWYSLGALGVSVLLLFLMLRLTLQPLRRIDAQARAIAAGQFTRIEPLPWTREVRNVAGSMNLMSGKIEATIQHLHRRLETLNERLLRDEVTGLYRRGSFATDLKLLFSDHGEGYAFAVRIDGLADWMRERGPEATDRFLKEFAGLLAGFALEQSPTSRAYRLHGPEFVLLLRGLTAAAVEEQARRLSQLLGEFGARVGQPDLAHVGIARCDPLENAERVLAAAAEACEQARLIGFNSFAIHRDHERGRSLEEWRSLVSRLIDRADYGLAYVGQVEDTVSGDLLMEEVFTQVADEAGQPIPTGAFVAMAERFGRVVALDRGVIERAAARLRAEGLSHAVAINLSMTTLRDGAFRNWLAEFLRGRPGLARQLIFSVSAYAAAKDLALFRDFAAFARQLGARIMLKRYEVQFVSIDAVKSLRPDFIRLARDLTAGISTDPGKRVLVEAMRELGELLDILVIAEQVQSKSDLEVVREIGLQGTSC